MIAVVLNPSQDRQLDEVSKVATRRASLESDNLEHLWVPKLSTYNNYIVFSTITYEWAGSEEKMLSFGFLGIVQTTGNIGDVMVELGVGWKRQKGKRARNRCETKMPFCNKE